MLLMLFTLAIHACMQKTLRCYFGTDPVLDAWTYKKEFRHKVGSSEICQISHLTEYIHLRNDF